MKEASGPCVNVSAVARRHGINPALLSRWRKEFETTEPSQMSLVPVVVAEPEDTGASLPASYKGSDAIEIVLANGRTVKVPAGMDPPTLKRLLATVDD